MKSIHIKSKQSTYVIRNAEPGDLNQVLRILKGNELPFEDIKEHFLQFYVVASFQETNDVVGVAGIETYGEFGLLRSIAVLPKWQNKSVAYLLTLNRIEWARSKYLKSLFLLTTTAPEYFKRFGFVEITRNRVPNAVRQSGEFSGDCPGNAKVMTLKLQISGDENV